MSIRTVGRIASFKPFEYAITGEIFGKTSCVQKIQATAGNVFKLLGNLVISLLNKGISLINYFGQKKASMTETEERASLSNLRKDLFPETCQKAPLTQQQKTYLAYKHLDSSITPVKS